MDSESMSKGPFVAETETGRPSKSLTDRITVPSLRSVRDRQPASDRARARRRRRTVALRVM
jgi:hypothetical protein